MNFLNFVAALNAWLGQRDYSVDDVTLFIRMAEERINTELRIKDNIKLVYGDLTENRVALPTDWLELDFVRIMDDRPLLYEGRDEFYLGPIAEHYGRYTLHGNNVVIGGTVDPAEGLRVEISYFARVPPFVDNPTWLIDLYPKLYTAASMWAGSSRGLEEERATYWESVVADEIITLNGKYKQAKSSGSLLIAKRRGFG